MSLINDYLKRLGGTSSSSTGRGKGVIPPALQRIQMSSMVKPTRKKFLLYAGIAVAVYFVGYFTLNMITLSHLPADQETVAVQTPPPVQQPAATITSATPDAKTRTGQYLQPAASLSPPLPVETSSENMTTTVVVPSGKQEEQQQVGIQESTLPPAAPAKVPEQQAADTAVPVEKIEKPAVEVTAKLGGTGDGRQQQVDSVDEQKKSETDISATHEEPYPLEGSVLATTGAAAATEDAGKPAGKRVFTESANKPAYYYQIALQAQHNNNFGRAERYYQTLLEVEPEHDNALINLAAIFILENRLSEADILLQKAIQLNPKNSKALVNAGMIALHQKKNEVAGDYFRQALKYNPIEETALINLAYLAQQEKQYDVAGSYYKKLTQITPDNTELLLTYAGLEEKQQQYTSAIDIYRRCLNQMSMQRQPELYVKIKQRIQILRQYAAQQANKDFFKVDQ